MRVDGTPVADTIDDLITSARMYTAIELDETGALRGSFAVRTATTANGTLDLTLGSCGDWTATTGTSLCGASYAGPPEWTENAANSCGANVPLYCFEVGANVVVTPPPVVGRVAFLSRPRTMVGLAGLDTQCRDDAAAAGLPRTFLAGVATTTSSVASRFVTDAREWRRVDGTLVARGDTTFFNAPTERHRFVHQRADGSYAGNTIQDVQMWVGATSPTGAGTAGDTCNNWMDMSATGTGRVGVATWRHVNFWQDTGVACDQPHPTLCLQE